VTLAWLAVLLAVALIAPASGQEKAQDKNSKYHLVLDAFVEPAGRST
jgi:hypothetical protein